MFTDLVGFSSWALRAGDEQVLRLLRAVTGVSQEAVARDRGTVVKSLGDGLMAVFTDAASAIAVCHEMGNATNAIILDGYRPQLRTGVHTGHPRVVGRDYVGIDVNIAGRRHLTPWRRGERVGRVRTWRPLRASRPGPEPMTTAPDRACRGRSSSVGSRGSSPGAGPWAWVPARSRTRQVRFPQANPPW